MNWKTRAKAYLIKYKGGKCEICGYDKDVPRVYHFHHRNPAEKDFSISQSSLSFDKLKLEVDKCDLLCANCHAEVHWKIDEKKRAARLLVKAKRLAPIICKHCNKKFKPTFGGQKFCTAECYHKNKRLLEWPNQKELEGLLWQLPASTLARCFGVSSKAIEKWAKSYKIGKPPRGYWAKKYGIRH